jgi:hypothetical protein
MPPFQLAEEGYGLYEKFGPEIPASSFLFILDKGVISYTLFSFE